MNIISADKITKSQGGKPLFENLSFGMEDTDRFALIGTNGCGKTTLLSIIAGRETLDSGTLTRSRDLDISFLPQIPLFDPAKTISDYFTKVPKHKADAILSELGIDNSGLVIGSLSGGMLKKVALAQALTAETDLLILDEPTNHLDIDTILWLQDYLQKYNKALLMVTHDRYFVDKVCTGILEIDRRQLFTYRGDYAYYLEKKAVFEHNLERTEDRMENILRSELAWLKQGPRARTTKSQDRIDRIKAMAGREKFEKEGAVELSITGRRLGKKILEVSGISKSYDGRKVVDDFSWIFKKNQKLGIVGKNGCGKSTLLNMLTGKIEPDSGVIDKGLHTCFGYFDQQGIELNPSMRLIDFIKSSAEIITLAGGLFLTASQMLEKFLFPSGMQYQTIAKLSGGEKRRLQLLYVLMKNPNFLILDEPTNDLDIKTLSILEDFLQKFEGCLLIVSHDRYFLDRCCDYLLVFDDAGSVSGFACDMSDYLELRKAMKEAQRQPKKEKTEPQIRPRDMEKKNKLTYKERLDLAEIVPAIEALEKEKADIEAQLSGMEKDLSKLAELGMRFENIGKLLDEKIQRWSELTEKEECQ